MSLFSSLFRTVARAPLARTQFLALFSTSPVSKSKFDKFDSTDKKPMDDSESLDMDKFVKQWLSKKVFQDQSINIFKPFLKNEEELSKMEWILHEYEIVKYETGICPSFIPPERVKELMEIPDLRRLHQYFNFLYSRENRKNAEKLRREEYRPDAAKALRYAHDNNLPLEMGIHFDQETGRPLYGKWRNGFFTDLGSKHEYTAFLPQNIAASQFGQKLVIDFSYENCMTQRERKSLVKQLCFGYQRVRESEDPFDLWFCNLNENDKTFSILDRTFGWHHKATFTNHFIHRTEQSYLDLFPRDKLVYLSPDSATDLTEFDDTAVYIIGGLVDRNIVKPVSLAKCKKEGIKQARLPLDHHLSMIGSKVLTLDQVLCILVRLKEGKTMEEALKEAVPERKLKKPEQVEFERNRRMLRLKLQRRNKDFYSAFT